MKTISPEDAALLAGPVVEPCYLIEIQLDQLYRFSTRQPFDWLGNQFVAGRVQGLRVTQSRASFGITDAALQHVTPALMGDYKRAPVRIWWSNGRGMRTPFFEAGYHEWGYYDGENDSPPLLAFVGRISSFDQLTTVLGVVATRAGGQTFPRLRVLPPLANFTRPEGTVISWGGTNYRIESRN